MRMKQDDLVHPVVVFYFVFLQFCASLPLQTELGNGVSVNMAADGVQSASMSTGEDNICLTKECSDVATLIKKNINDSVNPCDDFYEYACGNWIKDHKIPTGKLQVSAFTELKERNNVLLKEALVNDDYLDNIAPIQKVRTFFRSCLNKDRIDSLGKSPVHAFIKHLGSWAADSERSGWNADKWDVFETLKRIQREDTSTNLFFTVESIPDPMKRNQKDCKNILMIDKAPLDLPPILFFLHAKILRTLRDYITDVTKLTGVDKEIAKNASEDIIRFESKLAMLSVKTGLKRYARVEIAKLEKAIPGFPWFDHLQSLVYPNKLTREDPVLVLASPYLPTLFTTLLRTNKTTLSNFMVWRMIKSFVPMWDNDFRKVYNKLKMGKEVEESRVDECFLFTSKILSNLMGSLFLKKRFSLKIKSDVEEMMLDIVKAFKENAKFETWLSPQSREAVEIKLGKVFAKVGFPLELWNNQMLTAKYEKLDVQPDQWFQNVLNSQKFLNSLELQQVGDTVNHDKWIAPPQMVNAFYVLTKNEIVIPAGILQEPFYYSGSIPKALSYGAIGHILGHELTHGFDDQGRTFNKVGKKVFFNETGWSNVSDSNFKDESKCLVKQFNDYKVLGKHHVNGKLTLGENIADAGGVKLAYNAYKKWIGDHGQEKILPTLNKNSDELFFIGFAQKSCSHTTGPGQFMALNDDDHAPSKFRVIGTLANMKEFSDTFKCPPKSRMNPETKCDIW